MCDHVLDSTGGVMDMSQKRPYSQEANQALHTRCLHPHIVQPSWSAAKKSNLHMWEGAIHFFISPPPIIMDIRSADADQSKLVCRLVKSEYPKLLFPAVSLENWALLVPDDRFGNTFMEKQHSIRSTSRPHFCSGRSCVTANGDKERRTGLP